MQHALSRRFFAVILGSSIALSAMAATRCTVCGGRLPEQYWTYEDQLCCSQQCVNHLRPQCANCNITIQGKYVESEGETYCSETCFNHTLSKCEICTAPIHSGYSITRHNYCDSCANNSPACFSCGLPAAHPTHLDDDRVVCNTCMRWAVTTQEMAEKQYERALRHLQTWTSLKLNSVPKMKLVDRATMENQSQDLRKSDSPVPIRGLYSRQTYMRKRGIFGTWKESPEDAQETIYIIDHLHDEVFRVAAVHELMHDLVHEHFQRLKDAPLWVHEGICQLAAAEYCRRRNYVDVLQGIETCTDPDYGDGFRYINSITGFEGWNALRRWMETVDVETLPKTAPK